MSRKKRKPAPSKPRAAAPAPAQPEVAPPELDEEGHEELDEEGDEDADIAATRAAVQPLLNQGMSHHRLASAAGTHPDDMRGFLDGRTSLTPMLRARLRAQIDSLMDSLRPR